MWPAWTVSTGSGNPPRCCRPKRKLPIPRVGWRAPTAVRPQARDPMRIDSSVALTRSAVRRALEDLSKGELVVAAVSGGADSLALAAALAFVAPPRGLLAGAVT